MPEYDEEEPPKKKKENGINMTYVILGAILIIGLFVFLHFNPTWIQDNPLVILLVVVGIIIYFLSKSLPKFRRDPVEVFKTTFDGKDTFDMGYLFDFTEINFDDVTIYTDDEDTYRYIFNNPRMNRDMTIVIEYGMGWENVKSVEWDVKLKKKSFDGGGFFNPYGGYSRTNSSYRKPTPTKKNIPPSLK
jgi:hypothetical protein